MTLFDHLENLTRRKIYPDFSLEEVHKSYDPYMINRFLSMFDSWIPIVELTNRGAKWDKEAHYRFLFNLIPQVSVNFGNYIKKKKNEVKDEERQLLLKYFGFGKNDLDSALEILTTDQINEIIKKYKDVGKVR